jgi:hypothetical protein
MAATDPKDSHMDRTSPGSLAQLRAGLSALAGDRVTRRTLARELASYSSASERAELEAILARYSEDDTAEIRRILARRLARGRAA